MKHAGKAGAAGRKLILLTLILLVLLFGAGVLALLVGNIIVALGGAIIVLWLLFVAFTLYFFRDPTPQVPSNPDAVVAPAHGKVDMIDEVEETEFMGGRCRRISIFLSVFDVHVQNSPIGGRVVLLRHRPGKFLNALSADSAVHNENVLVGFDSTEKPGEKIAIRLIAGLIARRIIPWINPGETIARGERVSLIQFGSRVDLYLPLSAKIVVKLGDRVRGGETVMATRA
jgi:phosphatidylserine decarboxylase